MKDNRSQRTVTTFRARYQDGLVGLVSPPPSQLSSGQGQKGEDEDPSGRAREE